MVQGLNGKVHNKVDKTNDSGTVSRDSGSSCSPTNGPVSTNDAIRLTSHTSLLERLEKSLASLPAGHGARVAGIKAAIENGHYQIDAQAVAEAMIRFEQSLGD